MTTTTNIAEFGARERSMLIKLLQAWDKNGLPTNFDDSGVRPVMNKNSGCVFLTNEEYQVAMDTDNGELEMFYSTPYSGHEGFMDDLISEINHAWDPEDIDYLYCYADKYQKQAINNKLVSMGREPLPGENAA